LTRIPDGDFPDKDEFVRYVLAKLPQAQLAPCRDVVEVAFTYHAGRSWDSFIALRQIVKAELRNHEARTCAMVHRERAVATAYALVQWLRLIVCGGYAFREWDAGKSVFDENFVPQVISKLGQLLAALEILNYGASGLLLAYLGLSHIRTEIYDVLTADLRVTEAEISDPQPLASSMQLGPAEIDQLRYAHTFTSLAHVPLSVAVALHPASTRQRLQCFRRRPVVRPQRIMANARRCPQALGVRRALGVLQAHLRCSSGRHGRRLVCLSLSAFSWRLVVVFFSVFDY
jgi:hypothetical protein